MYSLLNETGLNTYYDIERNPGPTVKDSENSNEFLNLDEVKGRLLDFTEGNQSKITLYLPSVHCAACIWLLERLERLNKGVIKSEVNFIRKEVTVIFNHDIISLKDLVDLLESLGYPPDLQHQKQPRSKFRRELILKLGVAGFAFGNIMLFSFPEYLSLNEESLSEFAPLFSYLNLLLAIPVLLYSSTEYLRSAWKSLKVRYLTIDVPIALGIITLFARSSYEVISATGAGYFDSFAGLVFFLLIGKWYQGRTYEALAFDRDFKSYFPVAVNRLNKGGEEVCLLENIEVGDRIKILNNQIVPTDSVLIKGVASMDYSFVNGESDQVRKQEGELLFAGGRQCGSALEVEVYKPVQQSYLTSLWNQSAFSKDSDSRDLASLVDKVSRYFSIAILTIAFGSLAYWLVVDSTEAVDAFTAVLIIACPCALALSMPFASGNVSRILGRLGFFVKNTRILEQIADADHVVLDKTGTLTKINSTTVRFQGAVLSEAEQLALKSIVSNSTHPLSMAVANYLPVQAHKVINFREVLGLGIGGEVDGISVKMGSAQFCDIDPQAQVVDASVVHVVVDGRYLGYFRIEKSLRNGISELIKSLAKRYRLHLLSGDNDSDKQRMKELFGTEDALHFNHSPTDKMHYTANLQSDGKSVIMMGDGLNDAGALKQADVGIAIADDVFSFSPACDAILQADQLKRLGEFVRYIARSITVVKWSIIISLLYNVVGLFFAVRGELTPLVAAILMPLSSVTVVAFVTLLTTLIRPKSN